MEIIGSIAASTVIYFGGQEVIAGDLSVGAFFSFMTALFMLYTPLKRLSKVYNSIQTAIAANERVKEIMALKPTILSGKNLLNKNISKIEFDNVSVRFEDNYALQNIDFEINRGQKIALVGDSGGGKSTFVNMIIRFYDTVDGSIRFDDTDIKDIDIQNLRDNISIVTQRVYIFNDTIIKNIAYNSHDGLYEQDIEQKVIQALKLAHAWDFVKDLEHGIYSTLDEFGTNLSGGQRQRIAIARALYKNPQILIFDEATSALDNKSEEIIKDVIHEISKDKIVFIIAHRLSTIEDVDKIAVFKAGKIICLDTKEKLLDNCEEFKNLYL
jgi:subfamily B ATP-binding cassette protein MsbA